MKTRAIYLLVMLLVIFFSPRSSYSVLASQREGTVNNSADYLEALQTADAFLIAWVKRDTTNGLVLITERLRAQINDASWLRQYISGLSNPHHQAFEIGRGEKVGSNRFKFPVVLYELYIGETTGYAYSSTVQVIKDSEGWRIDVLPKSSDNP